MHYEEWMENVVKAFEIAGVVLLAVGSIVALVHAATVLKRGNLATRTEPHDQKSAPRSFSAWKS